MFIIIGDDLKNDLDNVFPMPHGVIHIRQKEKNYDSQKSIPPTALSCGRSIDDVVLGRSVRVVDTKDSV